MIGSDRRACCATCRDCSRTKGQSYIYIANGHGAWEAVLTTCCRAATRCWCWKAAGSPIGWGNAAAAMGAEVEVLKGDWRRAIRPAEVEARLRADKDHKHQGDPGGAGRYRLGRLQRHRSDRQGDQGCRPSGAVHGRRGGFARLHAVRDGRVGRRCRDVRLAEGPDDAAGPGLRRRQRPRPRGAQDTRACARPIGTGPSARAASTTANMPAPRRCICCSRCARRIDMLFEEGLKTSSCAIACWPKRCAARWRCGPRARCSASTSPKPASAPTRSRRSDGRTATTRPRCSVIARRNAAWCSASGIGELHRPGVPHRPYGPRQRADDSGHARRHRGRACRRSIFRTARAAPRPRSTGWGKV